MKPLEKNKKYDLSQLNDEQLLCVIRFIKKDNSFNLDKENLRVVKKHEIFYHKDDKEWQFTFITFDKEATNALELFEEEKEDIVCFDTPYKRRVFYYTKENALNYDKRKELPNINFTQDNKELKTYQIIECSKGGLGIKQGTIQATNRNQARLFHKESNGLKHSEKGFFSFEEIKNTNTFESLVDKGYLVKDKSIYDDMLSLMEKGKQHGLKIVVTFEKL